MTSPKSQWSPQELKALKHAHALMLSLETTAGSAAATTFLTEEALSPIRTALKVFTSSEHIELQKIANIATHLRAGMSLKQFSMWIIPVERALGRELRDDQFLIYTDDAQSASAEKIPLVFVLENLRSAFNVGSIFRTAECFGVEKIYLAGYTPHPDQDKLAKTAMGTDTLVTWEAAPKLVELLPRLRYKGYLIVGFETTSHAVEVQTEFPSQPTAFVFGNERFGLEADILSLCHEVRMIPLRGQKNSLNVGVATAIATYEFAKQFAGRSAVAAKADS